MDIHEMLQSAGQGLYEILTAVGEGIKNGWNAFIEWLASLPWPTAIKLFSNDTANMYIFFGVCIYILLMNIWAFSLFGADKAYAKRRDRRIRESKLIKVCFWGGAIGGLIGMNVFRHKTLKKKFSIGVPIMFILQLVLDSFILGFLAFWTFF